MSSSPIFPTSSADEPQYSLPTQLVDHLRASLESAMHDPDIMGDDTKLKEFLAERLNHPVLCESVTSNFDSPTATTGPVAEDEHIDWNDWILDSPVEDTVMGHNTLTSVTLSQSGGNSNNQGISTSTQGSPTATNSDFAQSSPDASNDDAHYREDAFFDTQISTSCSAASTLVEDPLPLIENSVQPLTEVGIPDPPLPGDIFGTTQTPSPEYNPDLQLEQYVSSISQRFNVSRNWELPSNRPIPLGFRSWAQYSEFSQAYFSQTSLMPFRKTLRDGNWPGFLAEMKRHFPGDVGGMILRRAMQASQVYGLPPDSFIVSAAKDFVKLYLGVEHTAPSSGALRCMIHAVWCIIQPNQHLLDELPEYREMLARLANRWPTELLMFTAGLTRSPRQNASTRPDAGQP